MRDRDMLVNTLDYVLDECLQNDYFTEDGTCKFAVAHNRKNLEVLREYLQTHKCEINDFIEADKRNRG